MVPLYFELDQCVRDRWYALIEGKWSKAAQISLRIGDIEEVFAKLILAAPERSKEDPGFVKNKDWEPEKE